MKSGYLIQVNITRMDDLHELEPISYGIGEDSSQDTFDAIREHIADAIEEDQDCAHRNADIDDQEGLNTAWCNDCGRNVTKEFDERTVEAIDGY